MQTFPQSWLDRWSSLVHCKLFEARGDFANGDVLRIPPNVSCDPGVGTARDDEEDGEEDDDGVDSGSIEGEPDDPPVDPND